MGVSSTHIQEVRVTFQPQPLKWQGIVKDLAEEFSCPISEVEQILSDAARQLEQGAHIKDFISVLAVKEVKGFLRGYRPTSPRREQRDLNHPLPNH